VNTSQRTLLISRVSHISKLSA